jgi:hypothetical protein
MSKGLFFLDAAKLSPMPHAQNTQIGVFTEGYKKSRPLCRNGFFSLKHQAMA